MVRPKSSKSKKRPKGGVDFKKYKRKIGRKLPPPTNATNTEIKSKAIILPEQSIASERGGLAVNKKGLTLRELLQQTSHHNAKIRKAALNGIKDLVLKYPSELKMHRLAIVEKLRERICDNDKIVRETLYHILKTVIFPQSKEDITEPIISLIMAYVFNAMTHMSINIRLMAFQFFELVVSSYPSSFNLYAEKVLDNYIDILKNNQIYLQDKSKLKNALGGLVHCLSLLTREEGEDNLPREPNFAKRSLHTFEPELSKDHTGDSAVFRKLEEIVPLLVNCFLEATSMIRGLTVIDAQSFDCMLCTLRCINLAVNIIVSVVNKPPVSSILVLGSPSDRPNFMKNIVLVLLKKLWEAFPIGQMHHSIPKEDEKYFILDIRTAEIFLHLSNSIDDSAFLSEKLLEFIESVLGQVGSNLSSGKVFIQKHLGSIIPFIPRLVSKVMYGWKARLLKAFTIAFIDCKVDSKMCLVYLLAIEEMLVPTNSQIALEFTPSNEDMSGHQITWLQELPKILLHLRDKNSSISKVVLKLLLRIGQCSLPDSLISLEYDYLQRPLREFYCLKTIEDKMQYGPFIMLPIDCQELAICSLYYFSSLSADVLESLAFCCLCDDLERTIVLRTIEVLHSAYKAGRVKISDQIAFLVTLVTRFRVSPEKFSAEENAGKLLNRGTFKSLTAAVCLCLSEMGDNSLVLRLLLKNIFNLFPVKLPLDNMHGLLKTIITLDARLMKLPDDDINTLGNWLSGYLMDAACYIPGNVDVAFNLDQIHIYRYYVKPCIFLLYGSQKLLCCLLKMLDSMTMVEDLSVPYEAVQLSKVHSVLSILIFMHNDVRLQRNLSSSVSAIKRILQNIQNLLASSKFSMTFEERHRIQSMFDQLKARACKVHFLDADYLEAAKR